MDKEQALDRKLEILFGLRPAKRRIRVAIKRKEREHLGGQMHRFIRAEHVPNVYCES